MTRCPHGIALDFKCADCEQIELVKLETVRSRVLMGEDCRPTVDPIAELRRELNAAHERIDELTKLLWEARGCVVRGSQLDRRIEDCLT